MLPTGLARFLWTSLLAGISRSMFLKGSLSTTLLISTSHDYDTILPSSSSSLPSSSLPSSSLPSSSLPSLDETVTRFRSDIQGILQQDPSLAGPLLRLAFHDATTKDGRNDGGPNGSILYEVERPENRGIMRPLKVVQGVLAAALENKHEYSLLSFADYVALAGAAAVETAGGPHIAIRLGRTDATAADPEFLKRPLYQSTPRSRVEKTLPSAGLDSDGLRLYFRRLGLSDAEFVALSGSHGLGRHVSLLGMPKSCLKNLTRTCLEDAPVLLPFVTQSVDRFDNSYFTALLKWNRNEVELGDVAFIPTDVALVVDAGLRQYVEQYANDQDLYFRTFAGAYQKLMDPNNPARTPASRRRY